MLRRAFVGHAHLRRSLPMRMGLEEFFDSQRLNKKTRDDKIVAGMFFLFYLFSSVDVFRKVHELSYF
jgi:hypothetical protein